VTLIDIAIPTISFLALAAVGMDLTPAHFRRLRDRPAIVTAGLLAPLVILPVLALGMLALFEPSPDVAAGILLVASCPIGGISNTYSYLARASTALSVTLTTLSCVLAVLTIPVTSSAFEWVLQRRLGFSAPASLLGQLLLMVLLPVLAGMWLRYRWPAVAVERRNGVQRSAFVALAVLLALIITNDPDAFAAGLTETIPLAVIFVAASFATGWFVGRTLGATRSEGFTLAAEFATRNIAVAAAIAVTLLEQPAFAIFAATYFLTELPLMLVAVAAYRAHVGVVEPA
jgi:BASS family bile acid:Na+ symporter